MRKLFTITLLFLGFSIFQGCTPDSVEEQNYEYAEESTDKDKNGTVGNQGGNDPDEDYN
jgi:hypothetical protein